MNEEQRDRGKPLTELVQAVMAMGYNLRRAGEELRRIAKSLLALEQAARRHGLDEETWETIQEEAADLEEVRLALSLLPRPRGFARAMADEEDERKQLAVCLLDTAWPRPAIFSYGAGSRGGATYGASGRSGWSGASTRCCGRPTPDGSRQDCHQGICCGPMQHRPTPGVHPASDLQDARRETVSDRRGGIEVGRGARGEAPAAGGETA
jgi:hypothetical protein